METPFRAGAAAPLPSSLWAATTASLPAMNSLSGNRSASVVVVGAGYLGLTAALALAEKGRDVILLEAAEVGWGASGRNNGLIAAGLKRDPDEVRRILGTVRGERLLHLSGTAPKMVFDLIERLNIDCDLTTCGWIQAAHSVRAMPLIERRVRAWQSLGADVELIPSQRVSERLGTDFYAGAWFDPRGGALNPLAYARGLAKAVVAAGASIYTGTPAICVERDGTAWRVSTPRAQIRCDHVIWCTNAYGAGNHDLHGTVLPLRTAQVASVPLPINSTAGVLPGGESCSDTQRLLTSFRLTADNRLIMGGASATAGDEHGGLMAHLHHAARQRFPQLGHIDWAFGWSGYLALTPDHLPQIMRMGEGYYAGFGCNGRGIAMATATGKAIADLICGQNENECSVPVTQPRRFFGFGLRHIGVAGSVLIKRLLDTAERRMFG